MAALTSELQLLHVTRAFQQRVKAAGASPNAAAAVAAAPGAQQDRDMLERLYKCVCFSFV